MPLKTVNITELRELLPQVEKALKQGHTVHATYRGIVRLVLTLPTSTHTRITLDDPKDGDTPKDSHQPQAVAAPTKPRLAPLPEGWVEDPDYMEQRAQQDAEDAAQNSDDRLDAEVNRILAEKKQAQSGQTGAK